MRRAKFVKYISVALIPFVLAAGWFIWSSHSRTENTKGSVAVTDGGRVWSGPFVLKKDLSERSPAGMNSREEIIRLLKLLPKDGHGFLYRKCFWENDYASCGALRSLYSKEDPALDRRVELRICGTGNKDSCSKYSETLEKNGNNSAAVDAIIFVCQRADASKRPGDCASVMDAIENNSFQKQTESAIESRDDSKAMASLDEDCRAGSPAACGALAVAYASNNSTKQALWAASLGCTKGHAGTCRVYGELFFHMNSPSGAREPLEKACDLDDVKACVALSWVAILLEDEKLYAKAHKSACELGAADSCSVFQNEEEGEEDAVVEDDEPGNFSGVQRHETEDSPPAATVKD